MTFSSDFEASQAAELESYCEEFLGKIVSVFVGDLWEPPARTVTFDGEPVLSVRGTCCEITRRMGRPVALLRLLDDYAQGAVILASNMEIRPGDN